MPRGRVGALSRSTYFPGTGDQLEDPRNVVVWECVRSNTFKEDDTVIKYGLLRGKDADSDTEMWEPITSLKKDWLYGIQTIRRRLSGDDSPDFREYEWSDETGTWRQAR